MHLDELALLYLQDHESLLQLHSSNRNGNGNGNSNGISSSGRGRGSSGRGGHGSNTTRAGSWLYTIRRMFLIISLNFQRALVLRLRARTSLMTYALIHIIMACALSSG